MVRAGSRAGRKGQGGSSSGAQAIAALEQLGTFAENADADAPLAAWCKEAVAAVHAAGFSSAVKAVLYDSGLCDVVFIPLVEQVDDAVVGLCLSINGRPLNCSKMLCDYIEDAKVEAVFDYLVAGAQNMELDLALRREMVECLTHQFQLCLSYPVIGRLCAPLVSALVLQDLPAPVFAELSQAAGPVRKAIRAAQKRLGNANNADTRMHWVQRMSTQLTLLLANGVSSDAESFGAACFRLLRIIMSQFPTSRFPRLLLQYSPLIGVWKNSEYSQQTGTTLLKQEAALYEEELYLPIDEADGHHLSRLEYRKIQGALVQRLQQSAYALFPDKLKVFSLSNYAFATNEIELANALESLSSAEIVALINKAPLVSLPNDLPLAEAAMKAVYISCITSRCKDRPGFDCPMLDVTEAIMNRSDLAQLMEPVESLPAALPAVTSQYLSYEDFIKRQFQFLCLRYECALRKSLLDVMAKIRSVSEPVEKLTVSHGLALKITSISNIQVFQPKVGQTWPQNVFVDVKLNLSKCSEKLRAMWEDQAQGDPVYLLHIESAHGGKLGIQKLRTGRIHEVLDSRSRPISKMMEPDGAVRIFRVALDAKKFEEDGEAGMEICSSMNVVVRGSKAVRDAYIKCFVFEAMGASGSKIPESIRDVMLGFGDTEPLEQTVPLYAQFPTLASIQEAFAGYTIPDTFSAHRGLELDTKERSISFIPEETDSGDTIVLDTSQTQALKSVYEKIVSVILGRPGTGRKLLVHKILLTGLECSSRHIIVFRNASSLREFALNLDARVDKLFSTVLYLTDDKMTHMTVPGRLQAIQNRISTLLACVDKLVKVLGMTGDHGKSIEAAGYFYQSLASSAFAKAQKDGIVPDALLELAHNLPVKTRANDLQSRFSQLFAEIAALRPYELLRQDAERAKFYVKSSARVLLITLADVAQHFQGLQDLAIHPDHVILMESSGMNDAETCFVLNAFGQKAKRVTLVGDAMQTPPANYPKLDYSVGIQNNMFKRLILADAAHALDRNYTARESIQGFALGHAVGGISGTAPVNAGFKYTAQFINVEDLDGEGESSPFPGYVQNLAEAEYSVAIYQYMRLLGYPAQKISILAPFAGQVALIKDIAQTRCGPVPFLGMPAEITNCDDATSNDYMILSLTRTHSLGTLSNEKTVLHALASARLGAYVVGRKSLLLRHPQHKLWLERMQREAPEDSLQLVTGEMYPTKRTTAVTDSTAMVNVQHLSQYVYEMTEKRLAISKQQQS